ncbi:translation initiation factor eIF-2B beta subunit [Martensiomyces pterosporus]|nr:translation initiation factor eIF-2B beta subunit [Martensiomyces pterosporus]
MVISPFTKDLNYLIEDFITRLKRGQIMGSMHVAVETTNLMRQIVSSSRWDDVPGLVDIIKRVGQRLMKAQPRELLMVNIICRTLHIIHEESNSIGMSVPSNSSATPGSAKGCDTPAMGLGQGGISSSKSLAEQVTRTLSNETKNMHHLKSSIIQSISEYIEELEGTEDGIAAHALEHIHSNEIIMTCGRSRTVECFLKAAARKRKFHVIVTECAPSYDGHEQAKALAGPNIEVVVIPDSAVFAIMSRVNKVILGTHAVMANGGLIAASGTHMVAAAARHHSTQVVVCTGLYKLSPLFPFDDDRFNTIVSPDAVLPYSDGDLVDAVDVANPRYDYVPPDLVDILVDHTGGHLPSYLYRLLQENYDKARDLAWDIHDQ